MVWCVEKLPALWPAEKCLPLIIEEFIVAVESASSGLLRRRGRDVLSKSGGRIICDIVDTACVILELASLNSTHALAVTHVCVHMHEPRPTASATYTRIEECLSLRQRAEHAKITIIKGQKS